MLVFPNIISGRDILEQHLTDLESRLNEIEISIPENIVLLFLGEKGPFGSLKTNAFVKKALTELRKLNTQGYSVLPVIDADSKYTLKEISIQDKEALERRLKYNGSWKSKLLEVFQEQITSVSEDKRKFLRLSPVEDSIYNLQKQNNPNSLGFPGVWMLYYSAEKGFYIQKIEPILIIPSCLVCPYGMIETLYQEGYNMEQKEKEILQRLNANGEKRRRNRPNDCPNPNCDLLFSHNEYGKVYRARDRVFGFSKILEEMTPDYNIITEETASGLRIAKIIGTLRNQKYK